MYQTWVHSYCAHIYVNRYILYIHKEWLSWLFIYPCFTQFPKKILGNATNKPNSVIWRCINFAVGRNFLKLPTEDEPKAAKEGICLQHRSQQVVIWEAVECSCQSSFLRRGNININYFASQIKLQTLSSAMSELVLTAVHITNKKPVAMKYSAVVDFVKAIFQHRNASQRKYHFRG
jgi:hypothetical protein